MNNFNDKDLGFDADSRTPRYNQSRPPQKGFSWPADTAQPHQPEPFPDGFDGGENGFDEQPPEKKSNVPMIIAIAAAVIVVLGAAGFLGYLFFFSGKGDEEKTVSTAPVATTEPVAETQPSTAPMKSNSVAKLVVMPDVVGMTESDAYKALNEADVKYKVTREYSEDVPINCIISQHPPADTEFTRGEEAIIYISKGRENEIVTMPSTAPPATAPKETEPGSTPSETKPQQDSGDYLLPDSDTRFINKSELAGFSRTELNLALNEIFARHGRIFSDPSIRAYFEGKSWYHGTVSAERFDMEVLNDYESYNVDLIVDYQTELGYR